MKKLPAASDGLLPIIPTMSKTDALLECQWPYDKRVTHVNGSSEAANFGTAFHTCMELLLRGKACDYKKIAVKYHVDSMALRSRVEPAWKVFRHWLEKDNPTGHNLLLKKNATIYVEFSLAWQPLSEVARKIANPTVDTHVYADAMPGEVPGTLDVLILVPSQATLIVLDHKSGYDVPVPTASGQLKSLGCAATAWLNDSFADHIDLIATTLIGFLHAPDTGFVTMYVDELTKSMQEEHTRKVVWALKHIGDGRLKPGTACTYCQAYSICPAQANAMVSLKRKPGALTSARVGEIHQALGVYEKLASGLRAELKGFVLKNGPVERPDGKVVGLAKRSRTTLSRASIERALGPVKGTREVSRLERLGCVETTEYTELRAGSEE